MHYDKIIIGAGLYGLYAALFCGRKGQKVLVLECESAPFMRATYINQARVHMGYHYPRSLSTAVKSAGYFERFVRDYDFCIHKEFKQIYATSQQFSWTDAKEFIKFCKDSGIVCEPVHTEAYFKQGMCDGAFLTKEYTYDAKLLAKYFVESIKEFPNVEFKFNAQIKEIQKDGAEYVISLKNREVVKAGFILNASYASTNQVLAMVGFEQFQIKYELCEIILCSVNEKLKNIGVTVMDGPFFSIMPFGKTGLHSLTSVTFTPHSTCYKSKPEFTCQNSVKEYCSFLHLGNCNLCLAKPGTAYDYMAHLANKYLKEDYHFQYENSLFSMKPILMSSEIDDSRPTVVRVFSENPTFVSVLSGKINTVYDLDEVLTDEL